MNEHSPPRLQPVPPQAIKKGDARKRWSFSRRRGILPSTPARYHRGERSQKPVDEKRVQE